MWGNIRSPCRDGFNIEFETSISEPSSNQPAHSFLYEHPWGNDRFYKRSPSVTVKNCKNAHSERTLKIECTPQCQIRIVYSASTPFSSHYTPFTGTYGVFNVYSTVPTALYIALYYLQYNYPCT